MTRCKVFLMLLALAVASPALAGVDIEIDGAGAYNYDGVVCTAAGTHANRTVPRCIGTGATGTFYLRTFTHVLGSAPTFTVASIRFVEVTEPDGTASASFIVECTAFPPNSDAHSAVTFGTDATVVVDLDADANCADINDECHSGASSATAIWNRNTGADCAGTACNNAELVCKVSYVGGGTDVDDTVDVSSVKLSLLP